MSKQPYVSVVIPVYQNAESLPLLFEKLEDVRIRLGAQGKSLEIIFVNDGSTDSSGTILKAFCDNRDDTKLVELSRNFGATLATKEGFRHVNGSCAMVLPADLQDPPELIIEMLPFWEAGSVVTICYRRTRKDPLLTRITSRLFYAVIRRFVVKNYPPSGGDVFLIDAKLITHLTGSSKAAYLQLLVHWLGYQPVYVPYDRQERDSGKSQWTMFKRLRTAIDIIVNFSSFPLRATVYGGFGVSIVGFLYAATVIIVTMIRGSTVPGYASLLAFFSFFCIFISASLAIHSEYLWRIWNELNRQPDVVLKVEKSLPQNAGLKSLNKIDGDESSE
jgi:glycosyltransferase involved in cell wall biosynthesis